MNNSSIELLESMSNDKFNIRTYHSNDEDAVIGLWKECGLIVPWNNPYSDIERKRSNSPELFFIGLLDDEIVTTCMAGYDGHRGWIYFLAVKKSFRKIGIAEKIVRHAEKALFDNGCAKIDLMVRNTNQGVIAFYKRVGYELDEVVVLSKRLVKEEPHHLL